MVPEIPDMGPSTFNIPPSTFHVPRGEPTAHLFYAYAGPSMNPTLDASDMLEVQRYVDKVPRVGDVIFFTPAGQDQAVVHRITKITPLGIYTRGDNNDSGDSWVLQPAEIAGRVVAAQRWNRRRRIAGGFAGILCGNVAGIRRTINRISSRLLHPAYIGLAQSGFIYRLTPASLRPRIVSFGNGDQRRLRLMIGRRFVAGQFDPCHKTWRVRRPFRVLLPRGTWNADARRQKNI
jgi:hypothetical protein